MRVDALERALALPFGVGVFVLVAENVDAAVAGLTQPTDHSELTVLGFGEDELTPEYLR